MLNPSRQHLNYTKWLQLASKNEPSELREVHDDGKLSDIQGKGMSRPVKSMTKNPSCHSRPFV
jgi:hypothetical protein